MKAKADTNQDNKYYEAMKQRYMASNSNEWLEYFCQLAEGMKLDVKRL